MPENVNLPEKWSWFIESAIVLVILFILSLILRKVVSILKKRTADKQGKWQRKTHKILHMPLQIAIWGFGIAYVVDLIGSHFGIDPIAKYAKPLRTAFIVACVGWVLVRWSKQAFNQMAKKSERLGVSPSTIYAISKLVSFVITILVLLVIFPIFGINILPLLAFGGIGVAGVAFAAQDMIANFFGGAMLHFTRSFVVGDEVVIPSINNFEGQVREIGWYITVIEDYYRRPVYFPNALFSKTHVINESRRSHRRIKETITLGYEDLPRLEEIVDDMREKIAAHPDVDDSQSYSLTFMTYTESGLDIFLYCLVYKMGYLKFLKVKQEILLIMRDVVEKHGAIFTYPTTNVNLSQVPPKN